jgi:hypothetical protein
MKKPMRNVHVRELEAPASVVGALLDTLAGPGDLLWPVRSWPPIRFDRPLGVGAAGGHSSIRYSVIEYEPGGRVRCAFAPDLGLDGWHELRVEPLGEHRSRLVHELVGTPRGAMRLLAPLVIRWLHDALMEDLLDNAERAATGRVRTPNRWSPWVRLLRMVRSPRPVPAPVPEAARLAFGPVDLADAWALRLPPRAPRSAVIWAETAFSDPPGWVRIALGLRQALVGLVGIERASADVFAPTVVSPGEATFGADAGHLIFQGLVLVDDRHATVVTLARAHNLRGRLYLALVRLVHPAVIRAMLRRAARTLAASPPVPAH